MISSHIDHIESWKQAMRVGLMNGRPYSIPCIKTYELYARKFLEEYGEISVENFKRAMLTISIDQFAKRLKLYEALNCFARYLIEEGLMEPGYIETVKRLKPRRHLPPRKLSVSETNLEKLTTFAETPLERLLVILLSQTGLRATEAAKLNIADIDFEGSILTVRQAKWGKSRRVGLTPPVIAALQAYLKARPDSDLPNLLINRKGEPMDRLGIRTRLNALGERAGVKVTPHALRRAFVTLNANKGRPLVMLQIACGHSDIGTTRSYCLTTEDDMIQAMREWV